MLRKEPIESPDGESLEGVGQTTQFIYDGDGNLVKKIKPDGSKTIYPSTTLTSSRYPSGGRAWVESMK